MSKPADPNITSRDLEIFRFVGLGRVASQEQLALRYWPDALSSTARDRLDLLVRTGYLDARSYKRQSRQRPERIYTLLDRGFDKLPRVVQERVGKGWPTPGELTQQLMANDARAAIEIRVAAAGLSLLDWRSVYELKSEHAQAVARANWHNLPTPPELIADAQAVVAGNGKQSIIDIEIDGAYFGRMLADKAASYGRSRRPVWWVCTPARASRVSSATAPYVNIKVVVLAE